MTNAKQTAFLKAYEPCHNPFLRYCVTLAYGKMEVEDLVQDILLSAYQNFDQIRQKDQLLHYLIRAARNRFLNQRRRAKYKVELIERHAERLIAQGTSPEVTLDVQILYQMLARLPEKQQEAVTLFEISGLSIKEIAQIQNRSEGAIKTQISRGRQKLRRLMGNQEEQTHSSWLLGILGLATSHVGDELPPFNFKPALSLKQVGSMVSNFSQFPLTSYTWFHQLNPKNILMSSLSKIMILGGLSVAFFWVFQSEQLPQLISDGNSDETFLPQAEEPQEQSFVIVGEVKNGEGLELSLSSPSEDFENRPKTRIKNGAFTFKGKYKKTEVAWIQVEYNIEQIAHIEFYVPVILEKDSVKISFSIEESRIRMNDQDYEKSYKFANIKYLRGEKNLFWRKKTDKLFQTIRGTTPDLMQIDSLNPYNFSKMKTAMLNIYKKELSRYARPNAYKATIPVDTQQEAGTNPDFDPVINIELLYFMFNEMVFYDRQYLTKEEINTLTNFFQEIAPKYAYIPKYRQMKRSIQEINGAQPKLTKFKDFTLLDESKKAVQLSDYLQKNGYTLLYFWKVVPWHSFIFNEKTVKKYKVLSQNGIQVININMNQYKKHWEKASDQGFIYGTNLYGGENEYLEEYYHMNTNPTILVLNTKREILDVEFNKFDELLQFVKK